MECSALSTESHAGPYHELRVSRIIRETEDACSVVLAIPEADRGLFEYRAGQFLTFRVPIGDDHLVRCYSLSSSPDTDPEHKVTVKRIPDGRVSTWFNESLEEGQSLQVMRPAGHFCLEGRSAPIVLFGAGSGITPVISILKSALRTTARRVKLVYANRDARSIIFEDELAALAAANPDRLELIHRLDDREGFLDAEAAATHVRAAPDADFYVCGPGPFMDVVEEALAAQGIAEEQIFIERFIYAPEAPTPAAPAPAPGEGVAVEVHLDGHVTELRCNPGETILEAADRAGLDAPCACRDGYCGACMAMVEEGEVEMKMNDGGLDQNQVAEGWVLTCQGIPRSARVRVDYPDPD